MTTTDRRIRAIAKGQLGAFTRTQAYDIGLSDRQLRSRVQSGILVPTGPNSFRLAGAPTSRLTELSDLVLDIGGDVWVTGPTAAALHGFDGFELRRPSHLLVPRRRNVQRWNVELHRTSEIAPIDCATREGLPTTSAVRTIIALAASCPADVLAAAIDSALRDGLLSERLLHRRIVELRSKGRYGLPLLHEVLAGHEATRGGHSWLEREYLRLLAVAHLPAPTTQPVLSRAGDRLVRVDCRFPGTPVVVELLGYRWHRTRSQSNRDAERQNALLADGFQPYQFTYEQIVSEPDYVVEATERALCAFRT